MATYVPAKSATAFVVYVALRSQANSTTFQANPTIAAGDFKVSIDGGALANLTTLPTVTPAAGKMVKISLSAAEMTGDNITVVCSDAAGAEWMDAVLNIQTTARQVDDLATSTALATVQADTDDIQTRLPAALDANGFMKADVEDWKGATAPANTGDAFARLGAPAGASVSADVAAVQSDTDNIQTRLPAALVSGRMDASVGAMAAGVQTTSSFAVGALDSTVLGTTAAQEIADAVLATAVDGSVTLKQILQIVGSAVAGKLSGAATTTITIRDVNDTRNCIVATVDADGNRSATTYTVV